MLDVKDCIIERIPRLFQKTSIVIQSCIIQCITTIPRINQFCIIVNIFHGLSYDGFSYRKALNLSC